MTDKELKKHMYKIEYSGFCEELEIEDMEQYNDIIRKWNFDEERGHNYGL